MALDASEYMSLSSRFKTVTFQPYKCQAVPFVQYFSTIEPSSTNFHISASENIIALQYKKNTMPDPSQAKQPGFDQLRRSVYVFRFDGRLIKQFSLPQAESVLGLQILSTGQICVLYTDGQIDVFTQTGVKIYFNRANTNPAVQLQVLQYKFNGDSLVLLYNDKSLVYCQSIAQAVASRRFRQKSLDFSQFAFLFKRPEAEIEIDAIYIRDNQIFLTGSEQTGDFLAVLQVKTIAASRKFQLADLTGDYTFQTGKTRFSDIIMHSSGEFVLLSSQANQQLAVLSFSQFNSDQVSPPKVQIIHQISVFEQLECAFFDVLPIYYNQLAQTVTAIVPKKQGVREVELLQSQIVTLVTVSDGVVAYAADQIGNSRIIEVPQLLQRICNLEQQSDCQKVYLAYEAYILSQSDKTAITRSDCLLKQCSNIQEAVQQLIAAANVAYDVLQSSLLLKAAAFAKLYVSSQYQSEITEKFDQAKKLLKIRAAFAQVAGYPLTGQQLQNSSLDNLVYQVANSGSFDFALKVCNFCKLDVQVAIKPILVLRAYTKVLDTSNSKRTDSDIFNEIQAELAQFNATGVYRTCAEMLTKENQRSGLVSQLIEKEPSLIDQIKLFLELRQYAKAIKKAYEAFSEDLVIESFAKAISDPELDQKAFYRQLFDYGTQQEGQTSPGVVSNITAKIDNLTNNANNESVKTSKEFVDYIKQLVIQKELQSAQNTNKFQLDKYRDSFLDSEQTISSIGECINDQSIGYAYRLQRYNSERPQVFADHATYLEQLQGLTEPKSDQRQQVDMQIQVQQFLSSSKIASSFQDQKDISIAGVSRTYGREAIRQLLQNSNKTQYVQLQASNSAILDDFKKFASFCIKKCDCNDELMFSNVLIGIVDGIDQFGKSAGDVMWAKQSGSSLIEDYFKGLSSRQQQKISNLIVLKIAEILPDLIKNDRVFATTILGLIDKRTTIKAALICQNPQLLSKGLEGAGAFEMTLVHQSWKSMSKAMQDAARSAVSGQQ